MQYSIVGDNLPALILRLAPGETIVSEVGGRTWSRGNIVTETRGGSLGKALGRMISGESLFLSYYTAQSPAEIAFTSSLPGRIVVRELGPGESVICQKSAFLCATYGVELSVHLQRKIGAGLVGGEGFTYVTQTESGADVKNGEIATHGWTKTTGTDIDTFMKMMEGMGVATVICTDVSRDGALMGTNMELYRALSAKYGVGIIASGGITTVEEVFTLAKMNVFGAILGKAIYNGNIDLREAVKAETI